MEGKTKAGCEGQRKRENRDQRLAEEVKEESQNEQNMSESSGENNFSAVEQDIEAAKRAAGGQGESLEKIYNGYFSSRENCEIFAENIPPEIFELENPTIIDAGSSQGILGNYIREKFIASSKKAKLVMVDMNKVAMEKSPVQADKVVGDLVKNPLPDESADIVLLRSVLQYVEGKDQAAILRQIYRVLKPGGILVSQFGSFKDKEQAEAFNGIFGFAHRKVSFSGKEEGIALHEQIFDEISRISVGPKLYEKFDEFFVTRVNASPADIAEAKKYISEHVERLGEVLTRKDNPYAWKIPYTIITCKKKE
ncbi:MAG: class I SAM-dependent methyltransferase [Parcubacteria group bacterium]|jgi:ubiquinone/menaquinone biosynthesis C-methylase UbiE